MIKSKQIKSKQRVTNFGEVFTNQREVNAMLDLVKHETVRLESKFLEPACGDGNFLVEILRRKLEIVFKKYRKIQSDYDRFSVVAVTSIYGVDILEDNAQICRKNLYNIWEDMYRKSYKKNPEERLQKTIKYILFKNILCGDALTMLQDDGNPITFVQWELIKDNLIKRKDYQLSELLIKEHYTLINFLEQNFLEARRSKWEMDKFTNEIIPIPIKEYDLIDYRKVFEYE